MGNERGVMSAVDLDYALVHELGELGAYQRRLILLSMVAIMTHAFASEYIFSAAALPHSWHSM